MYVVMVYDVGVERVNKVLKVARRYLRWVQNSVLEGDLSFSQFRMLKEEVRRVILPEEDSVRFYVVKFKEVLRVEKLGKEKGYEGMII